MAPSDAGPLHLGVDAKTGTIVASTLTSKEVDDAAELGPLLDQIDDPLAAVIADGAYDQDRVYDGVAEHSAEAVVVVPPRSTAVLSASAETNPTQRDRHIQVIAEQGRMAWQKTSGYNARAGAEGTMSRYKRIIGDTSRSQEAHRFVFALPAGTSRRISCRVVRPFFTLSSESSCNVRKPERRAISQISSDRLPAKTASRIKPSTDKTS